MRRGRIAALSVAAAIAGSALAPSGAAAHPLGNFSVNHLSQVRISDGRAELHYILDQAEIPTFQEAQKFDTNGDGKVTGAETGPLLRAKLAEIALRNELERLRGERRGSRRDRPYPTRTAEVRSGRPIS